MVRSNKWIKGTTPQQPITTVARRALRERLKAVRYYAPLAAKRWEEDIEHVHQIRVATRRARAALHIFAHLLPQREARWMKRRLRELRGAAGKARDLDVLAARLQSITEETKGSHLGPVVEQVLARRRKAQKPLVTTYKNAERKGFKQRSRAIAKAVRWRHEQQEPTFTETARTKLVPLVDNFFVAAAADLSNIEALHQMRIASKEIRYAMELLAGAFEDSFRSELYATFAEVQEKLGTINDHATAIAMFNEWYERADYNGSRAELAGLTANEEEQLNAKCQGFRDWWTAERATELAHHFATLLWIPSSSTAGDASSENPRKKEREGIGAASSTGEAVA